MYKKRWWAYRTLNIMQKKKREVPVQYETTAEGQLEHHGR